MGEEGGKPAPAEDRQAEIGSGPGDSGECQSGRRCHGGFPPDSERQWRGASACCYVAHMSDDTRRQERTEPEAPWPSFALPRGTVVNGYRIERVLGSGGFGITYLAIDLLDQRFAIKEYYPRQFATREHMTVRPTTIEDDAAVRGVPRALPARGAGAGPARPCRRRRRRHRARADLLRGVRHLLPGDGLRRGHQPRQRVAPGARRSRRRLACARC